MVPKTGYTVAGIIIALLIGSGAGYIYGQSPIAGYQEDVDRLEAENQAQFLENTVLQDQKAQLLEENTALQDQLEGVQESFNDLESSIEKLENDYRGLLSTLSILDAKNYSRTEEFELLPGQTQRYEYDVGYGIVWVVEISHTYSSGSRFGCYISWWQGEQGGMVSGGCDTIEQQLSKVTGTVSTQVYDEGDVLFIMSNVNVPEFPRFCRDGNGRLLKKTFEETKIVVNGDFEEPTWNVEGWETSGHLGAGSGEDSLEGRQLGLAQDLGAVASQKVYLYKRDLYLEFYYRAVPMGIPLDFIVYFDDNVVLNESFTGSILPWTSMRISLDPLMDTYGEHTIKFVVPKSPDCTDESSRVMIDKVSIS